MDDQKIQELQNRGKEIYDGIMIPPELDEIVKKTIGSRDKESIDKQYKETRSPISEIMKYIGAAYILWLALHIALSRPSGDGSEKSASFWKGFMLQFVNVKIYLFGITALTGYVTNYSTALWMLLFSELVIATIGTIATTAWIGAGVAIQKVYLQHYRPINIILALTLLECVYSILK